MRPLIPLIFALALCGWPGFGHADSAGWHATQVTGEVRVEIGKQAPVPLKLAMTIDEDALIETAASGSATLMHGEDQLIVAPNSRLRLPREDATGITHVIEELGELFFKVSKRSEPHFRVDTPLLAATVKGTAFSIWVDDKGTNVRVSEGLVLVQNNTSSDSTFVSAGRVATIAAARPMELYLDRTIVPPAGLRLGDATDHHAEFDKVAGAAIPQMPRSRLSAGHPGDLAEPLVVLSLPQKDAHHQPAAMVIDWTLTGVGAGIIAAAFAIAFIGSRRSPKSLRAKAKRAPSGN